MMRIYQLKKLRFTAKKIWTRTKKCEYFYRPAESPETSDGF
jgi:hypothetical protein